MTYKEKIRKVVEKRYEYWREKESNSHSIESEIRMSECQHLLLMLNSLQEEPVSEELEEAAIRSAMLKKDIPKEHLHEYPYNEYGRRKFIEGVQWQKTKDESTTEDLGDYINELSKQFPEVSFAKLSRIAVRVSKWKDGQLGNQGGLKYE